MRAGYTVFLISTRNAPAAVADMLERTGAGHVIVSSDSFMRGVAKEALSSLSANDKHIIEIGIPAFEELFAEKLELSSPYEAQVVLPTSFDMMGAAAILHSSGTSRRISRRLGDR